MSENNIPAKAVPVADSKFRRAIIEFSKEYMVLFAIAVLAIVTIIVETKICDCCKYDEYHASVRASDYGLPWNDFCDYRRVY